MLCKAQTTKVDTSKYVLRIDTLRFECIYVDTTTNLLTYAKGLQIKSGYGLKKIKKDIFINVNRNFQIKKGTKYVAIKQKWIWDKRFTK